MPARIFGGTRFVKNASKFYYLAKGDHFSNSKIKEFSNYNRNFPPENNSLLSHFSLIKNQQIQ